MIEHIVKQNEKINDIMNDYHLTFEEIKRYNSHITDFNNLIGGTKLLIPLINQEVNQVLDKTEVFVKKYYPKITEDVIPNIDNFDPKVKEELKSDIKQVNEIKQTNNIKRGMPYPGILPPKKPYRKI